ncbi:hypothetical protein V2J09_002626 [Rumex salicifolius]
MSSSPKSCYSPKKMSATSGWVFPIVGLASIVAILYVSFGDMRLGFFTKPNLSFVQRNGTQLFLDGKPFYINGWNSYWLMDHAVDGFSRPRISGILQAGSKMGLTVCRTWGFNDGTYHALQVAPGLFNEQVFKALDYVVAEAGRYRVRLILSLVNNLKAYGGKTQYVKWAWQEGIGISSSNDSFFYDPSIRTYFKSYIKTVLTRKNTITGVEYRDDPAIFAWEIINEPRCMSDPTGDTLQDWIKDMSTYVKSLDNKHLVTVGLEGFYGPKDPKRMIVNPSSWESTIGTDFIRNSLLPTIDFASVHLYPDQWLRTNRLEDKLEFVHKWLSSHIDDGNNRLKKPIMLTEFGLSSNTKGFHPRHRDRLIQLIYDTIYKSAREGGSGAGSLIWQLFVGGMEDYHDDFSIIPWQRPTTCKLLTSQSCRLARIHGNDDPTGNLDRLCPRTG